MEYLNQLTGDKFSLSLVVRERRGAGVIAYLVPTHLIGDPVTGAMDRLRMAPRDGKHWYPIVEAQDLRSALTALETTISAVVVRRHAGIEISVGKYAAMVWNTATATIQHREPVKSITAILKMDDIAQLIPPDKNDPPCCGL